MKHQRRDFDVIVVGGGHAGVEAASAAQRRGARTALITHRFDRIGEMSCNPAIGGLGKGHLVREIDALDGVMGRLADYAGIQFRLLNRSKGAAVRGPRAQCDRARYRAASQREVLRQRIDIIADEVIDLIVEGDLVRGVSLASGTSLHSGSVVLTTGTFLSGVVHIGALTKFAGREGDKSATRLSARLREAISGVGRLKTGTPPRLERRSIDWSQIAPQDGDECPSLFSMMSGHVHCRQISCGITHTNERTHEIVADNASRSAMYSGNISGVGPRYCPSIEDKIMRFAEKQSHQIFLEPEGLDSDLIYPNGISTSLPAEVQESFVRTITGLERAIISQFGYAIEYDFFDPRFLNRSLESKAIRGLYFAGQINGTTGYEEAAAQGLVCGLNAAATALNLAPAEFTRDSSYIGVLVDDLTSKGVTEPYRMFTSRAEHRLHLRIDNADRRLTPYGLELGVVSEERRIAFDLRVTEFNIGKELLTDFTLTPQQAAVHGIAVRMDGRRRDGWTLVGNELANWSDMAAAIPELDMLSSDIAADLQVEAFYSKYVERFQEECARANEFSSVVIPHDLDFSVISGLSNEVRDRLTRLRPGSIGEAERMEGMTPAGVVVLLAAVRKHKSVCPAGVSA